MNITKVSPEMATDLIHLINGCKGITYNAKADYTTKSGGRTEFEYVTLDKIYAHIKNDNNFALLEPLGTNEAGQPALQIILIHKTGEAITSDYYVLRFPVNASKQDEGSAITYTKRYALGSFLGLCTDEDNDASPNGEGMGSETPPKQATFRERLIARLKEKGINLQEFAIANQITTQTTEEEYKKFLKELG